MGLDAAQDAYAPTASNPTHPFEGLGIRKILTPDVDEHIDKTTCTKCSTGVLSVP